MSKPTKYTRIFDYQPATLPDLRSNLNPEFDAIQNASNETIDALADIRRDDGALRNGIVSRDTLTSDVFTELESLESQASVSASEASVSASEAAASATKAEGHETQTKIYRDDAFSFASVGLVEEGVVYDFGYIGDTNIFPTDFGGL